MIDLDATTSDLHNAALVDRGRLKPGGRREIEDEIHELDDRGLRAHVLVLASEDSPADGKPLWDRLHLDERGDLLLISNGKEWEARGWGLTRSQIDLAMADSAPAYHTYLGKGIVRSLAALAAAAGTRPSSAPASRASGGGGSSAWLGLGIAGAAAAGLVGFAIHRRNKRAHEASGEFTAACTAAERAYTELVLACEELGGEAGSELQLKATDLKQRLDAVIAEARGKIDKMTDRVVLGRINQLASELAALRSTQLQKARGQS